MLPSVFINDQISILWRLERFFNKLQNNLTSIVVVTYKPISMHSNMLYQILVPCSKIVDVFLIKQSGVLYQIVCVKKFLLERNRHAIKVLSAINGN